MEFKVNLKLDSAVNRIENAGTIGIRMMMEDIKRIAEPRTPKKDGNLRGAVTMTMENPYTGVIKWWMPYASYQERGRRANPPYHGVKHYTTPGTGKGFVKNAVEQVAPKFAEYIMRGGLL